MFVYVINVISVNAWKYGFYRIYLMSNFFAAEQITIKSKMGEFSLHKSVGSRIVVFSSGEM